MKDMTFQEVKEYLRANNFIPIKDSIYYQGIRIGQQELDLFDFLGNFYGVYMPEELDEVLTPNNLKILHRYYDFYYDNDTKIL